MDQESAREAHGIAVPKGPSGLRRLSPAMLETDKLARGFTGKPEGQGVQKPGQVLAAFKAAAPHMGFGPRIVHAIDWLFTFTQPQDWVEGSHPIVWPSAALQRQALDLGVTQAKALNRLLVELGLVVMKDSPNGKRFGRRDAKGRLIEAYGFDLAPLAARQAEFEAAAAAGRAERESHPAASPAGHHRAQRSGPDHGDRRRTRGRFGIRVYAGIGINTFMPSSRLCRSGAPCHCRTPLFWRLARHNQRPAKNVRSLSLAR